MRILNEPIHHPDLAAAANFDGEMVKAVVDVRQGIIALDAEMHADLEQFLLKSGSNQSDLWGINLYPDESSLEDLVEFDSLINIRPRQQNRTRSVENPEIRKQIFEVVKKWIR